MGRGVARKMAFLALAAAAGAGVAHAGYVLECHSKGYAYAYCPADTRNGVEFDSQQSDTSCLIDQSWGYDAGGVWVDKGCRAVFRILSSAGRDAPVAEALISPDALASLQDEDREDGREPGYGAADAAQACAAHANAEIRRAGAASTKVLVIGKTVARGRRAFDVELSLLVVQPDGDESSQRVRCTVQANRITSFVKR